MLTWKLWYRLGHPPANHPLFFRTFRAKPVVVFGQMNRLVAFLALVALLAMCTVPFFPSLLFLGVIYLPLLFLLFSSTVYGVLWAVSIGSAIGKEREQGTYDLLCSTPAGTWGVNWVLCTGCMHRSQSFHRVHTNVRNTIILVVATLALCALVIFSVIAFSENNRTRGISITALLVILSTAVMMAGFYIDYVQSTVISGLVGILTARYGKTRIDMRLWALGIFLVLQIGVYVVFAVVAFIILPGLVTALNFTGDWIEFCLWIIRILALYMIRELIIFYLWRILQNQLNFSRGEANVMRGLPRWSRI